MFVYIYILMIGAHICVGQGMSSLMSQQGINELNIFIFVLAAMQIVYSLATMGLGRAKVQFQYSYNHIYIFPKHSYTHIV